MMESDENGKIALDEELGDSVVDTGVPLGDYQDAADQQYHLQDQDPLAHLQGMRQETIHDDSIQIRPNIPCIGYEYRDTEGLGDEMNEWFDYEDPEEAVVEGKRVFTERFGRWGKLSSQEHSDIVRKLLIGDPDLDQLLALGYVCMGSFGDASTVEAHLWQAKDNCRLVWHSGGLNWLYRVCLDLLDRRCPPTLAQIVSRGLHSAKEEDASSINGYKKLRCALTCLYFMIECLRGDSKFSADLWGLKPGILPTLMTVTMRLKWAHESILPSKQLLLLVWKCILCLFGDSEKLKTSKKHQDAKYHTGDDDSMSNGNEITTNDHHDDHRTKQDDDDDKASLIASPLDYHAFREDLVSRYPSYIPPPSKLPESYNNNQSITHYIEIPRPAHMQASNASLPPPTVHIATPAPSPPSTPAIASGQRVRKSGFMSNPAYPFIHPTDEGSVPDSIIEGSELFASRVRTKPSMVQLWQERERFMKYERGWTDESLLEVKETMGQDGGTPREEGIERLERVEEFYRDYFHHLGAYVDIVLRIMLGFINFNGSGAEYLGLEKMRAKEINFKAISGILLLLSQWLKASHILKYEYFCTVLFDSRFYLLVYKFLYTQDILERVLYVPEVPRLNFLAQCREHSDSASIDYGLTLRDIETISACEAKQRGKVDAFSKRYMFALINFLRVLRKIIKGKTQRVLIVAELPSDTLKRSLVIYHRAIWRVVLDIFKSQVPFNGRKWKSNNMELVSAIYLHCKARLREDWLSGTDINAEVDDAYPQEVAIRSLVRFYNETRYEEHRSPPDKPGFFAQELDALSTSLFQKRFN
ncbi:hypothetical protein TRVA0_011S01772 [Trichomonascus vanleenenianus]|uniref:Far11p n=1 Tax=Trichomonascus vanleenenianus TaxID=2268995 RepID=UPI003ECAC03F